MDLKNPVWEHQAQEAYGNENPKNSPGENFEKEFQNFCRNCCDKNNQHFCDDCKAMTLSGDKEPACYIPKNPTVSPRKPKKKLNDLDKYLIFAFSSLILFTVAVLCIFIMTGNEPTVLVGCFFAAFGGEILTCALIKKLKLHKEMKEKGDDYGGNNRFS